MSTRENKCLIARAFSLFLLATETVLRKAAIKQRVWLLTGQAQSLLTYQQTIKCDGKRANLMYVPTFRYLNRFLNISLLLFSMICKSGY